MSDQFVLKSEYKPSGDQPKAIKELTNTLKEKNSKATLIGVTGSGKTFTMAGVIENLQRPTLIITHNKTLAAQLYREFRTFFPDNGIEYFISYYDYYQPEAYVAVSDTFIEKEATINDEIEMLRLRATSSLLERRDVIIIASVSCIYGLGSPEDYRNSVVFLKKNMQLERDELLHRLIAMQYARNDLELKQAQFAVRGDIIDIFPAYSSEIYRVEFFGNEVERLLTVDPITKETKRLLDQAAVYPAKHFITAPPRLKVAIEAISNELEERISFFHKNNMLLEAERIKQRTLYDIEMLREMGYCSGIENYSRHLVGRPAGSRPACLIDYFPSDFLVIIDESHVSVPQIGGMYAGDRSRKETLVKFGFRLPSALDNRPLNFHEFENIASNVLYVSATPSSYELENSDNHVEQIIRPTGLLDPIVEIVKTEGQIDHLSFEIIRRTKKNERTLVTTLTKKMAEDLTDYFLDRGIQARYMHSDINSIERVEIIRDLRRGDFDCLIGINLLREGLDLPEVSLVAILDADKEGFLRSRTSLIQTIGRVARNEFGKAILYADRVTESMKLAIDETNRRRKIQDSFNKKNGITPKTIHKKVVDIIERNRFFEKKLTEDMDFLLSKFSRENFKSKADFEQSVEEEMLDAAKNLQFEKATLLRDILQGKLK